MQVPFKQSPIAGMDLDSDETRIQKDKVAFMKNMTMAINSNPGSADGEGANYGVLTPFEGLQNIEHPTFPDGQNIVVGYHESRDTREGYVFVWNDLASHFIYRINNDGSIQLVYVGANLNFQLNPENFIAEGRCTLHVEQYYNKKLDKIDYRKYLIFTDNFNPQRFISVEDSIATKSFDSGLHPYFAQGSNICDSEYLINLGVAPPMDCIGITRVARPDTDEEKKFQNLMINNMWQFRIKFIDVFFRESEHGIISESFITVVGGACISTSNGLPRCVDLSFDAGCPLVDKIQIEFRRCFATTDLVSDTDWFLYDIINKYDNSDNTKLWWERAINPDISFDAGTNKITYRFCNDKKCEPIDVNETNRFYNPLPVLSSGLAKLDRSILLSNNVRGYDPLNPEELDKVEFTVNAPSGDDSCSGEQKRKIVVYMPIWNPYEEVYSRIRERNGQIVFGNANCNKNNPISYGMILANTEGWVGYLAGTPYSVVSEQVRHFPGTSYVLDNYEGPYTQNPFFLYQRWIFEVPPGKYVFRVAGHGATLNVDYAKTSTYVIGKSTWATQNASPGSYIETKELVIDVCSGDHLSDSMSDEVIMLLDMTFTNNKTLIDCLSNATGVVDGYVREDVVGGLPIENAKVLVQWSSPIFTFAAINGIGVTKTDHNGFYFGSCIAKKLYCYVMFVDCVRMHMLTNHNVIDNWNSPVGHMKHLDLYGYLGSDVFPDAGRRIVKGKIVLCDQPTVGIGGVLVIRATGAWGLTDANGQYAISCHEWYDGTTTDRLIYSQKGACTLTDCNDFCQQCFTDAVFNYVPCTGGIRITNLGNKSVGIKGLNKYGVQTGGRYGVGLIMHDWMGRSSFVQSLDKHFVDIPTLLETHSFEPTTIGFNLNGAIFPDWVKFITLAITPNLNFGDFQMWSVDKVEKIDAAGNINNAAATQMRVYIGSLTEFNFKNNLATTDTWQFLTKLNDQDASVSGDRVQFLMNGDGVWYDHDITLLVNYDTLGQYFVVDYNQDLADLKQGAMIKFMRPKDCSLSDTYFEVCPVIKVFDGEAETQTGVLKYFDTYFLERQIPIPVFTTTLQNGQPVTTKAVTAHNYGYLYEHPSPSDFWGDHCHTKGRPQTKNSYERQKRLDTELALSMVSTNRGNFNGLSYFDTGLSKEYDKQQWGAITVVIVEVTTLLILCDRNNFLASYKDNHVFIDQDNTISAGNTSFSPAQRKIGNTFGCSMIDINTIRTQDGLVIFVDRAKAALVFHAFSDADDASKKGFKSYLSRKIGQQNTLALGNPANHYYFVGGIDPKTNEYFLTSFSLFQEAGEGRLVWNATYVNNDSDIDVSHNDTLVVDMDLGTPKGFVSFTPEYYGSFESFISHKNMFSFKWAEPWKHHNYVNDLIPYNNFYGEQCKKYIQPVVNISPEKVKHFQYSEVYCKEHKFIIQPVITEAGQVSRVLAAFWVFSEKFWSADYKCNLLSFVDPSLPAYLQNVKLLDGDNLYGRWAKVMYRSEDADDAKYCEIGAIVNYVIGAEKSAD